jgi:hypothetical protein
VQKDELGSRPQVYNKICAGVNEDRKIIFQMVLRNAALAFPTNKRTTIDTDSDRHPVASSGDEDPDPQRIKRERFDDFEGREALAQYLPHENAYNEGQEGNDIKVRGIEECQTLAYQPYNLNHSMSVFTVATNLPYVLCGPPS